MNPKKTENKAITDRLQLHQKSESPQNKILYRLQSQYQMYRGPGCY